MSIATTIRNQIGGKSLYMIGAKNLIDHGNGLSLRTGRVAAGKANYIKITLNASDTYDMEFQKIAKNCKVIAEETGVYFDMLHGMIEQHTGLYTSL